MTEPNATSTTRASANRGVKRGLPPTGLAVAEDAAIKLWAVARLGTATPEAFARQFDERAKASGSTWDTRMSMLRGFKLVRFDEKQVGLSELGQKLVNSSDPKGQIKARQTAVLNLKAYRELVEAFDGTELPTIAALSAKLQYEYGKTEIFAKRAAQAFADSLRHAEMLDEQNTVRKEGVNHLARAASFDASSTTEVAPEGSEDDIRAADIDHAFDDGYENIVDEPSLLRQFKQGGSTQAAAPNVSLTLTLDLSNFRVEDVVKILGVLGFGSAGER